jgi:hypothetical protein
MPTIIVSIQDPDYTTKICISVDYDGLERNIYKGKVNIVEHGKAIRFYRDNLHMVEHYPHIHSLIDKRLNLLKLAKTNNEHYKVSIMLYKAIIKNKDLAKLLPEFKKKHKQLFNDKLELLEEASSKEWVDDGIYLEMVNDTKYTYDKCMIEYDIFDKLITNPSALCVE